MLLAVLIPMILWVQSVPSAGFEVELWPGEGLPVFEAVAQQLQLHEQPSPSSKVVHTLKVRPRQRLVFDDTRYRTVKAGRFVVLASTTVTGRNLGGIRRLSRSDYYSAKFPSATVPVEAGDTIEYLQYRAEGTCFVRIGGATIDADACPLQKQAEFRLEVQPVTEWWIRIIVDGEAKGWLLVTDATVKVVARKG